MSARALPVAAACAALLVLSGASVAAGPTAITLVSVKGHVYAFAQDGPRLAWVTDDPACPARVVERVVATGHEDVLTTAAGDTCASSDQGAYPSGELALAGTTAVWGLGSASNQESDVTLVLGSPGRRDREGPLVSFNGGVENPSGVVPVPVAGDRGTLVYADVGNFDPAPGGGVVYRLRGGTATTVGLVTGARAVAVDDPRVATAYRSAAGLPLSGSPAWSPDGRQIAYESAVDGYRGVYVTGPGGGGRRLVGYSLAGFAGTPAWSPDSRQLAYAADGVLHVVAADGTGDRPVGTHGLTVEDPAWSPDGSRLAFGADQELDVVGVDGKGLHAIRRTDNGSLFFQRPSWSPDGTRLAYVENDTDTGPRLAVVRADGGGRTVLGDGSDPAWSPDGRLLAAVGPGCRLELLRPDGTLVRELTAPAGKTCDARPAWSPDGRTLVFARGAGGSADLWLVGADGAGLRRLTTTVPSPPRNLLSVTGGATIRDVAATAVALSGPTLAALVGDRIRIYDAGSGALLRSVAAAGAAPELALSQHRLVFRRGRAILLLDTATGRVRQLARAGATPVGLSIQGTRVAWGESLGKSGRIRAIELPAG